jgi:hypothetical protein
VSLSLVANGSVEDIKLIADELAGSPIEVEVGTALHDRNL